MPEDYFQPELIKITKDNVFIFDCKGESIKGIAVDVCGYNYDKALEISRDMWCGEKKNSTYGGGLGNTDEDPKKVERTGRLGEIAFAMILGLSVDARYIKNGDKEDFNINGKSCDIKTAMKMPYYGNGLILGSVKGNKIDLKNDMYIFAYVLREDRVRKIATIVIVGCILKKDISTELHPPMKKNGDNENYEVPYTSLRSITELKLFKEKQTYRINKQKEKHNVETKD